MADLLEYTDTPLSPNKAVTVLAAEHPFQPMKEVDGDFYVGMTLQEVLEKVQPDILVRQNAVVFINDMEIAPQLWRIVKPKQGAVIYIREIPQGGGGRKSLLRVVLTLAVIVAAYYFGPALGAMVLGGPSTTVFGFTLTAQAVGGAIISAVGNLLVNALAPIRPPSLGGLSNQNKESPTLQITGASNQANQWGVVPVVLGKHKMYPPYGALPYTEIVGGEQYLRLVFVWGHGPLLIENLKIGETPLENFTDVEVVHRAGYADDSGLTLYTRDVFEESLSVIVRHGSYLTSSSISFAATTKRITIAGGTSWITKGFAVGDVVTIAGSASNNGTFTITALTATVMTVSEIVVTESAGASITVTCALKPSTPTIRVTQSEADEISVDFVFMKGLVTYNNSGVRTDRTVEFDVEYALDGTEDWVGAGLGLSARNSPTIPDATATRTVNGGSRTLSNPHRKDLVVLDRYTGAIEVITGVYAYGTDEAVAPTCPATKIALASVERVVGVNNILNAAITDLRTADSPFGTPATDFAVTEQAVPNDTVRVAAGSLNAGKTQTVTARTAESYFHTVRFAVPVRGKYKVRVTRTTDDATSDKTLDELTWGILRTFTNEEPFDCTGLATTELRIKATDQLNQVIDQLSGEVTSILPDWDVDLGDWVVRPTQNPASHARAVLQGGGNARALPDSRLNLDMVERLYGSFEYFHENCTANDFKFNMVRDFESSVWETLVDICGVAFASPAYIDDKWGIIIDEDKVVPANHYTPLNSYNFSFKTVYPTRPHAWRIRFVNEENEYKQDEIIVYDDGYDEDNAELFESFEIAGATNPRHVWKIGRRRIAEARLRRESYEFSCDFENLLCTRGDLILLTHDVIASGLGSARVASLITNGSDTTGFVLNSEFDLEVGQRYGVVIRNATNGKITREITAASAGAGVSTFMFTESIATASGPAADDLVAIGLLGEETLECIVLSVRPLSDMAATIRCVPLARPIFSAYDGTIPDYTPNVTVDAGLVTPFITGIRSDESVLTQLPNGLMSPTIRLTFGRFSSSLINRPVGIEVQYKEENETVYKSLFTLKQEIVQLDIVGVVQGDTYDIRARYVLTSGVGDFTSVYSHEVIGMATPPPDPYDAVLEGEYLRWKYTDEIIRDWKGFEVRTSTDVDADWTLMTKCHDGFLKDAEFNITNYQRGTRKFLIKAVDLADNYSDGYASLSRTFPDIVEFDNIVEIVDIGADGFLGTYDGLALSGGQVETVSATVYLPEDSAVYLPTGTDLYLPDSYPTGTYTTNQVFVSADRVPSRMTVDTTFTGALRIEYRLGVDDLYLPDGAALYVNGADDTELYLPPTWQTEEFRDFPAYLEPQENDVYQFQVTLYGGETQATLSEMQVIFDVEDQFETLTNVALSALGTRLSLTKTYRSVKMVSVTILSGSAAFKVEVVDLNATLGPLLQGKDAAGAAASATVNVIVQGVKG